VSIIDQIDLMARGGTLALLGLWGWIMVREHRATRVARVALLLVVTVACHVTADLYPLVRISDVGLFLLKVGQTTAPAAFWLFARALFDDDARIGWRSAAVVGLSGQLGLSAVVGVQTDQSGYPVIDRRALCSVAWHPPHRVLHSAAAGSNP
jgi:hypothetical protein